MVVARPLTDLETAVLNHVVAYPDDRGVLGDGAQQWLDDARRLYGPNQAAKWARTTLEQVTALAKTGKPFVHTIEVDGAKPVIVTSVAEAQAAIETLKAHVAETAVMAALQAKVARHSIDGTWADGTQREGYLSAKARLGSAYETRACRETREITEKITRANSKQAAIEDGSYVPAWSGGVSLKALSR